MTATRVVPSTPIGRATSDDTSRYAIAGVQPIVSPHKAEAGAIVGGFLVATNGRMLAVAAAEFHDPPAMSLPIIPNDAIRGAVTGITLNGKIESHGGTRKKPRTTLHAPIEGTFPPCGDVTKGVVDGETQWIGLSAKLLIDLAAALGAGENSHIYLGVKVKMVDPPHDPKVGLPPDAVKVPLLVANKPVAVLPGGDGMNGRAFGILMPVNCTDETETTTERFTRLHGDFTVAWDRHEALLAGQEPVPYVEDEEVESDAEPEPEPVVPQDGPAWAGGAPEIKAPPPPVPHAPLAAIALAKKLGIVIPVAA